MRVWCGAGGDINMVGSLVVREKWVGQAPAYRFTQTLRYYSCVK